MPIQEAPKGKPNFTPGNGQQAKPTGKTEQMAQRSSRKTIVFEDSLSDRIKDALPGVAVAAVGAGLFYYATSKYCVPMSWQQMAAYGVGSVCALAGGYYAFKKVID
jgi:hypothetical protein